MGQKHLGNSSIGNTVWVMVRFIISPYCLAVALSLNPAGLFSFHHANFITSLTKEVMFLAVLVCLSVCLPVCLFVCLFVCLWTTLLKKL